MATPKVYVFCDQNCKFEGMTKEQILTAIVQAVSEGAIGDIDTGFITTIKTINGNPLQFFVGEQSEYDALTAAEKDNVFAIITNDMTKAELLIALTEVQKAYEELTEGLVDGSVVPAVIAAQKLTPDGWKVALENGTIMINERPSGGYTPINIPLAAGKTYLLKIETSTTCDTAVISIGGEGVESYVPIGRRVWNLGGAQDVMMKYVNGAAYFVGYDENGSTETYSNILNATLKYRELF